MAIPPAFAINHAKISEQVYEYLHGEIISGRLIPGQRLNLDELVMKLSDNRRLIEIYHRLRVPIHVAAIHYRSGGWITRVVQEQKEHRAIVRALEQKDAAAVSHAINHHLKRGSTSLLEDVERSQSAIKSASSR